MSYIVYQDTTRSFSASHTASTYGTVTSSVSVTCTAAGAVTYSVTNSQSASVSDTPKVGYLLQINGNTLYNGYYGSSGSYTVYCGHNTFPRAGGSNKSTSASGGAGSTSASSFNVTVGVGSGQSSTSNSSNTFYRNYYTVYGVSFNLDGGTRTGGGATYQECASGGSVTPPTVTRTGYTFAGWNGSYTNVTSDRTLTAQWTINRYNLSINPNGGYRVSDGNTSTITVPKTYGQTEAISECVRDNYILAGYTLTNSSNGSTTDLGGASFTFDSATKTGTFTQGTVACTLTANWVVDAYVITYDDNGGSNGPGSTAIEIGSSGTITTTIPTRQGYTFVGWAPGIETSPIRIQPGDSFTPTGDITFYAIWEEWTYSVIFDANGGYGSLPSNYSDIPGYVSIGIGDEKPSSVGGIFLNWNTKADGTGITYNSGDMIDLPQTSSTITIYAMYYSTDIYFNSDCSIECIEFIEDSTCSEPYLEPTGKMFAQEFIEHDGDIMFEGGIVYASCFIEKQLIAIPGKSPDTVYQIVDTNGNILVDNSGYTLVGC